MSTDQFHKGGFVNLVTIRAKPGTVDEIFSSVRQEVLANEPFTKSYKPALSTEDPLEIWLWEHYDSDEALAQHRKSAPFLVWAKNRDRLTESIIIKRLKPM